MTYSTAYPNGDTHYILDGEPLTLQCDFTGTVKTVVWQTLRDGNQTFYSESPGSNPSIGDTVYKSRIIRDQSKFVTNNRHQLVIEVDKQQDDGQVFRCFVATEENIFGSEKDRQLGEILGEKKLQHRDTMRCWGSHIADLITLYHYCNHKNRLLFTYLLSVFT